ncbi:MAG: hypothetical protein E7580_03445 [Ruminococcaceae bacterium]|nr:hypothetical protein [Oscillospiraceae bacterium]
MTTFDELRAIQKKNEKKALCFFVLYQFLLLLFTVCGFSFTSFFDRKALQFLPLALCLLGFFLSKIFLFLQPREFRGTIKYLNVAIEQKKKYLSGQAGLTYAATQHKVLDLVVEHKTGRSRSVTLPYRKAYEDLKIGDEVILLRFVDAVSPIS